MKKMLQMFIVMTLLVMASPSLFSMCDMKMEPMNAPCKSLADLAGDRAVAYLEDAVQESLLKLHELYPNWGSELFKQLCRDLKSKANVLLHEQAVQVVDECAAFCDQELKKNVAYKQALEVIKADLQDYQQFLASAESRLNPQDEMATKRRCCAPAVNCFNIAPFIPFLPTGPIVPVTSNLFYATREFTTVGTPIPAASTPTAFTVAPFNTGGWSYTAGGNTFTALVAGTYLITAEIPFTVGLLALGTNEFFLQPVLASSPVASATVSYRHGLITAGLDDTVSLSTTFIVSVAVGDVLTINTFQTTPGLDFFYVPTSQVAGWNNGSITIIRIL